MESLYCEDDLDEERAKRSILVTNVPQNVTDKDVIIHFQRKSRGGGEVDSGKYFDRQDQTSVVITFEEPSTVETAIGHCPHTIRGTEVTVQRYPTARLPEIFSVVDARLNPDIFKSESTLAHLLVLQREYGIKYHESCYGYIISGSYKQIQSSHKYILDNISKTKHNEPRRSRSEQSYMGTKAAKSDDRGITSESEDEKIDVKIFQTVPIILEYMFTVPKYRKKIDVIGLEFAVEISGSKDRSKVGIYPLPKCTPLKYDDACEEYIKLYREITDGDMMSKDLVLKPGNGSHYLSAEEAVKEVLQEAPVVIQLLEEPDTWLFYGEDDKVRSAIKEVCKKLKIENPFRKARKVIARPVTEDEEEGAGAAVNHVAPLDRKTGRDDPGGKTYSSKNPIFKDFPSYKDGCFEITTKKGFHLSVHQGDITQEPVDVIVNSSDEYLGFLTGLPAAFVIEGGDQIRQEAQAQSKKMKATVGDIITTGSGRLHCSNIMHILTCKHSKKTTEDCKKVVKNSCFNCLKITQRKKLKSIAFPAVGSGQQKMPLRICATAMINAVEEYMKENNPQEGAVADIRYVDSDPSAVDAFKTELTKRYGDSITTSSIKIEASRKSKHKTPTLSGLDMGNGSSFDKKTEVKDEDVCPICLDGFHNPITLTKCNHKFCKMCIDKAFIHRKTCPTCGMAYGVQTGNMPKGTMHCSPCSYRLPGYERYGTIAITYHFPSGTQGPEHPNPGQYYHGTSRTAYLPDCHEGREVLDLLKKAFDARLTFTIGTSVTTGATNVVTWNDIHHKTDPYGGATGFGYPDPTYLKRVKAELAAKGIS